MEFDTAQAVWEVTQDLIQSDNVRSQDRALIDRLFNGEPPFTPDQAIADNVDTNVNFKEAPAAAHEARRQYYNGFLRNEQYFNVTLDGAPPDKAMAWARYISSNINRCMKNNACYRETLKGQFAQTAIHGKGPVYWPDRYRWYPKSVGLSDFLIPSQTRTSFDNLSHFCIMQRWTAAELFSMVHGGRTDKGWNVTEVDRILKWLYKTKSTTQPLDYDITPEKLAELYKENRGYWNSDVVPTVLVYDFYYREPERDNDWFRCMILGSIEGDGTLVPNDFLYKKDEPVSPTWEHLIHLQFGNGANTAPFLYHSVRGLGFMTFDLYHLNNRLRSRWADHVFQQLILLFRVGSPADQDRLQKVDLTNWGTIPEGLGFVTAQERFVINPQIIDMFLQQNHRTLAQNTSAWTQDLAHSKDTAMTAFETAARIQASNAMISSMLADAYEYADKQYREICRRFTLKVNPDKDVRKFREYCKRDGVPDEWIDVDRWIVRAERVVGDGNKMLEMAQTQSLMNAYSLLDPDSQRLLLHLLVQAHTDPRMAETMVPLENRKIPDIVFEAQQDAAVLMMNMPLALRQDINHIDYVESLLASMTMIVQQIEQGQQGMASPQQFSGLMNMGNHIAQHIQIIAQNKGNKERVRQYGDVLGQLGNLVKAYGQRLQEQQEAQGDGQLSPEARAQIMESVIMAQTKARIDEARAAQKMQLKNAQFMHEMQRRDAEKALELRDQALRTQADIAALDAKTAAEIRRDGSKPQTPTRQ